MCFHKIGLREFWPPPSQFWFWAPFVHHWYIGPPLHLSRALYSSLILSPTCTVSSSSISCQGLPAPVSLGPSALSGSSLSLPFSCLQPRETLPLLLGPFWIHHCLCLRPAILEPSMPHGGSLSPSDCPVVGEIVLSLFVAQFTAMSRSTDLSQLTWIWIPALSLTH